LAVPWWRLRVVLIMAKIFEATGQLITSGLHPSLPDSEVPLWRDGDNIVFTEQSARPGLGQFPLFAFLDAGRGLGIIEHEIEYATQSLKYAFWGTRTKLWMGVDPTNTLGSVTPVDVTRAAGVYTGTRDDLWSIASFGTVVIATNGVDEVQVLVPSGEPNSALFVNLSTVSDLPDTFRAKLVAVSGPFILFFNTDNSNQEVRWGDEDSFATFQPASDNFARDLIIRDIQSDIRAVLDLGGGLAMYGRDQVHWVQFAGPPFFFQTDHLLSGVGAVGKHSVVAVGRQHYGFGPTGIYVTDGSGFEYIDKPSIHDYIYGKLDVLLANRVIGWEDQKQEMVFWSFPTITGIGETVGFNYRTGAWGKYGYYRTAAVASAVFNSPLLIDTNGSVLVQGGSGGVSGGNPIVLTTTGAFSIGYGYGGYGIGRYGGNYPTVEE